MEETTDLLDGKKKGVFEAFMELIRALIRLLKRMLK